MSFNIKRELARYDAPLFQLAHSLKDRRDQAQKTVVDEMHLKDEIELW